MKRMNKGYEKHKKENKSEKAQKSESEKQILKNQEKPETKEDKEKARLIESLKDILEDILKKYGKETKAVWALRLDKKMLLVFLLSDSAKNDVCSYILKKQSNDIKIDIRKLSEYFSSIMQNNEEYFSEIQKSIVLYDPSGIIRPIKIIIEEGRIKKTKESMMHLVVDVGQKIREIKDTKLDALSTIYSAAIEAAQAPLLLRGYSLLIPSTIPKMLEIFLKEKEISKNSISDFNEIYSAYKDYEHGRIKDINGKKLELLAKKADRFVDAMQQLARQLIKKAG